MTYVRRDTWASRNSRCAGGVGGSCAGVRGSRWNCVFSTLASAPGPACLWRGPSMVDSGPGPRAQGPGLSRWEGRPGRCHGLCQELGKDAPAPPSSWLSSMELLTWAT